MPTVQTLIPLLHQYGYLFLFLVAVVEGPIITIVGIFLATLGYFNIYAVYSVTVVGDLTGDMFYYCIGRFGRRSLSARWEKTESSAKRLRRLEAYFRRHGVKVLFYAKYTQTGLIALPAAGAARMPVGKFLWYNLLGTVPKSLGLALVGYFFGYAYNQIDSYFARFALIGFGVACLIGAWLFSRQFKQIEP